MAAARTYKARGINGHESYRWDSPQTPTISVRPGDIVELNWWGDSGVPQWCNRSKAVVVACNRKRLVVHPLVACDGFTLSVLPERHVSGVTYKDEVAA